MNEAAVGQPTAWRVTGLADPSRWTVEASEGMPLEVRIDGQHLVVDTVVGAHSYIVGPR